MGRAKKVEKPLPSVQERMEATAIKYGAEIDGEIDHFTLSGYKSTFKPKSYFKGYQISGPVAKRLREFYAPHLDELKATLATTDKEEREQYGCSDAALKRYIHFMEGIVEACDIAIEQAKVTRKPRARKIKPPDVLVASMKHLSEIPELGITGHDPETIIGASEAWFYDAEKRKLLWYRATDRDGLSVKGTTILNYDENTSGSKPVRKPEVFFKDLAIGCRGLLRSWNEIRGKVSPIKGRTNDNMILLTVGPRQF